MSIISNVLNAVVGEANSCNYECRVYTEPTDGDGDRLDKQELGKVHVTPDYAARRPGRDLIVNGEHGRTAITPADVSKVVAESNGAMSVFTERWEQDEAGNAVLVRKRYVFSRLAPEQPA